MDRTAVDRERSDGCLLSGAARRGAAVPVRDVLGQDLIARGPWEAPITQALRLCFFNDLRVRRYLCAY